MTNLSAADRSQISTESTGATSEGTAEVIVQSIVDRPCEHLIAKDHFDAIVATLVTEDHLDARLETMQAHSDGPFETMQAHSDASLERTMPKQMIWLMSMTFAFNSLLAAWFSAFH